jgi:ElaB/YqjD/DUF883 family membrane-anchored ribosome-binding protein
MNSTDDQQTTSRSFPAYPDFRNPQPMNPSPQDVIQPAVDQATETLQNVQKQARQQVREHPLTVVLVALGAGLAAGLVLRALSTPPPPPTTRQRIQNALEDIQSRLMDLAQPAYKRASEFAGSGADMMKKGIDQVQDHVSDLHIEKKINGILGRIKGLFG